MSDQVTEIVYLPLKPDLDLNVGEIKDAWALFLATIAKQPGCKSMFWGHQIEHPGIVQMVVAWDSISSHQAFMSSPEYAPFLENVATHVMGGAPTIFHVEFHPTNDLTPMKAPVTECISAYFVPSFAQHAYSGAFSTFRAKMNGPLEATAKGLIGGWSVEKHQHEKLGEGVDGNMFATFIGWTTVEAHMEFRKTEEFARIIPLLRQGPEALRVWHVKFEQYK